MSFVRRWGWSRRKAFPYTTVQGWLHEEEAVALFDLSRDAVSAAVDQGPIFVEIGSWLGKSSYLLAAPLSARPDAALYCIDPFNAAGEGGSHEVYEGWSAQLPRSLKEQFVFNMQRLGVLPSIRILQGYSRDFSDDFAHPIDVLFIDGNHSYEAVLADFQSWAPKVKPGGTIAFHDSVLPGVARVIDEEVQGNPDWTEGEYKETIFLAKKTLRQ